jgi:polysaccharide export outer membrane protein
MKTGLVIAFVAGTFPCWAQVGRISSDALQDQPAPRAEPRLGVTQPEPALPIRPGTAADPGLPPSSEIPSFSEYRLGPEDLVSVQVLDAPEFSRLVRVSAAGTIRLPLVEEPIAAEGKTSAELEEKVAQVLVAEGLLRNPAVSVVVREVNSKPITVSGAVRMPAVFQAPRPMRLLEAISRAGGLSELAGSSITVSVPARDGQPARTVTVNRNELLESAGEAALTLRGGEQIRVLPAGRIFIVGGVQRPGPVPVSDVESITLLEAVSLAGGALPEAGTKALVLRTSVVDASRQELTFDIRKLMRGQEPDVPLQANDLVFIPHSRARRYTDTGITSALSTLIFGAGVLLWR